MPDRMLDPLMSGSSGSLDLGPVESQDVFTQPVPVSWQDEALSARSQPDGGLSITFQVRHSTLNLVMSFSPRAPEPHS